LRPQLLAGGSPTPLTLTLSRWRGRGNWLIVAVVLVAIAACGPFCGNGKFNLSNAHVQASSKCPPNSNNFNYTTPATVDVSNETSQTVTIKKVQSDSTITATHGNWGSAVGTKGGETDIAFNPKSFSAGQKGTVRLTLDWQCTNNAADPTTYADFRLVLSFQTSAGTYKVSLNKYRMSMG
jgi:hypothetical protein